MINLRVFFLAAFILFITVRGGASQEKQTVFAISPMASPVSTISGYNDFINYLSQKTGTNIVMKL